MSYAGSNTRVGSPGNFEAEIRLPRQNCNTLNVPRQSLALFFNNMNKDCIRLPRQELIYRDRIQVPSSMYRGRILVYVTPCDSHILN